MTNMTKQNVIDCQVWSDGTRFQVMVSIFKQGRPCHTVKTCPPNTTLISHCVLFPKVDDHKTVRSFGQAAFCLNKDEYGWLHHISQGKCCLRGRDCPYVFHSSFGLQIGKPANILSTAWEDAGMKGLIDFNKIRSSVSTQV